MFWCEARDYDSFREGRSAMEPIASHYAVLLHDDRLRRTLVKVAVHDNRRWPLRIPSMRARLHLAHALHALAARIDSNPTNAELIPYSATVVVDGRIG
jgi:hypothetical protein